MNLTYFLPAIVFVFLFAFALNIHLPILKKLTTQFFQSSNSLVRLLGAIVIGGTGGFLILNYFKEIPILKDHTGNHTLVVLIVGIPAAVIIWVFRNEDKRSKVC